MPYELMRMMVGVGMRMMVGEGGGGGGCVNKKHFFCNNAQHIRRNSSQGSFQPCASKRGVGDQVTFPGILTPHWTVAVYCCDVIDFKYVLLIARVHSTTESSAWLMQGPGSSLLAHSLLGHPSTVISLHRAPG